MKKIIQIKKPTKSKKVIIEKPIKMTKKITQKQTSANKPIKPTNSNVFIEEDIFIISGFKIFSEQMNDVILNEKIKNSDILLLNAVYYCAGQFDKISCTVSYIKTKLNWTEKRIKSAQRKLKLYGLINDLCTKKTPIKKQKTQMTPIFKMPVQINPYYADQMTYVKSIKNDN